MPNRIRIISLDAGNTLIHPHPSVGEVYAQHLAAFGGRADPDSLQQRFLTAFKTVFDDKPRKTSPGDERAYWREVVRRTLGDRVAADRFDPLFDRLYEAFAHADCWKPAGGVRDVLENLNRRGYRLIVFSNSDPRIHGVFEELGMTPYFEKIYVSAEIGWEKPAGQAFRHVQSDTGVRPEEILHVGDSVGADGRGARAAGWHACLVHPGKDPDDRIPVLPSLRRLPAFLHSLR